MRSDDRLRQIEQRAVGAGFGSEHIQTRGAYVTGDDRVSQGLLIDEAAAGGVDDDHAGLGLGQCFLAQQPGGLLGLGQVHRDEVGAGQYIVQRQQFDAELRGAGRRNVGVIGDDVGAEGGQSRGDQLPDAAQAHHSDSLAEDLSAIERRALPGVLMQGRIGRRDLPCGSQHERNRMLSSAVDIGGGRIDHQHTGRGGSIHINVVQADTGTGDDLELGCRGDHLSIDGSGRTHQQRIGIDDRCQQFRAVRAVHPPHLHLVSQGGDGRFGKFVGDQYNGHAHPNRLMGSNQ